MNLKVTYFENIITFCNEMIQVIEIENKKIFYQFVNNLFYIKNGEKINDLYFYDNQNKEIDLTSKIEI